MTTNEKKLKQLECWDRIKPIHRARFSRYINNLESLMESIREYEPEASIISNGKEIILVLGSNEKAFSIDAENFGIYIKESGE